jgi:hypothetical protein
MAALSTFYVGYMFVFNVLAFHYRQRIDDIQLRYDMDVQRLVTTNKRLQDENWELLKLPKIESSKRKSKS